MRRCPHLHPDKAGQANSARSAGFAIRSPRGIGDPHVIRASRLTASELDLNMPLGLRAASGRPGFSNKNERVVRESAAKDGGHAGCFSEYTTALALTRNSQVLRLPANPCKNSSKASVPRPRQGGRDRGRRK